MGEIPGVDEKTLKKATLEMGRLAQWMRQGVSIMCTLPSAATGDPIKGYKDDVLSVFKAVLLLSGCFSNLVCVPDPQTL